MIFRKYKQIGIVLLYLLQLCYSEQTLAQQDPMYSQYTHNPLTINPAYAGSNNMLSAQLLVRNQWVGFEGAPKTKTFTIHTPFRNYQMASGLSVINDELGPVKKNSFYMDFAYHLKLNRRAHLGMGIKAGFDMLEVNLTSLNPVDPDEQFQINYSEDFLLNFGAGLYFYTAQFYVGLAAPRFLKNKLEEGRVSGTSSNYNDVYYYLTSGALFYLNKNFKLKPSVLLKVVPDAPLSVDVSANLIYQGMLWLGLSYRSDDAVSIMTQYQITDQIRLGYAYDMPTSKVRSYINGTHEITVAYDFRFNKRRVKTPRYF